MRRILLHLSCAAPAHTRFENARATPLLHTQRTRDSHSSDNALGALFLALVYGYAVLRGAMLIGDGGEALMDLKLAPAVIGGEPAGVLPRGCVRARGVRRLGETKGVE